MTLTPTPADVERERPGTRLDDWWARRLRTPARARLWYWGAPVSVTLLAAFLRFWNLGWPHALVFDETYYVKDAWSLWHLGYEATWPNGSDADFIAGRVWGFHTTAEFVAHPPLGKWIIGLGMALFGVDNSFSWRVMTALVGTLAVLLLFLIARYLFKSTIIAFIAGFLLAIDGLAIVMSRVSLLDTMVMFFALLAFGCILLDRRWHATRLAARVASARALGKDPAWGPVLWWRPWLMAAGVLAGLCAGVKWSGIYFLAFFAVYTVVVDLVARRREKLPLYATGAVLGQGPATFLVMVPLACVAYLATWTGWFVTSGGYNRSGSGEAPWTGLFAWVPRSLQSWWEFQQQIYAFNINLHTPHPYAANPWGWTLMIRPTNMYYTGSAYGHSGCTSPSGCSAAITGLGNPLIWWAGTAAILYLIYRLARFREWRTGIILMGFAAGYTPWLLYAGRTIFTFYSIAFAPYLILALTAVIALVLGHRTDPESRRWRGIAWVTVFLSAATLLSTFFWPIWTAMPIPTWFWQSHMWFLSWI